MKADPFVIERTYNASIEKVWEAITDKAKMKQWYFDLAEFKPQVEFEFRFWGGTEENKYLHICTITEVIPARKLAHTWTYDGYEGETIVTFELFDEGNGKTKVRLTHAGLETLPPIPDFNRTNFEQGWTHIIGTSLAEYLAQ